MEFFFGMLGALAGLWLYRAGEKAGRERPAAPGAEQKEGLVQSQEAFRFLQNYSAEQAYGLGRQSEVET